MKEQKKQKQSRKVVSIRLSQDEIRLLKSLGDGDLTAGIRKIVSKASLDYPSASFRGYRVVQERIKHAGEGASRYSLLLDDSEVGGPLIVSDSIYSALCERFGQNHVMKEVIIGSFVDLPNEVKLDKVHDGSGKVTWSLY